LPSIEGSALATSLFSNKQSKNLVVFGAGAQAEAHINLILAVRKEINTCIIINRVENDRLLNLRARLEGHYRLLNRPVTFKILVKSPTKEEDFKQAIREADIICTATSSTEPLFSGTLPKRGCHLNLIGSYKPSMCEVDEHLVRRAAGGIVVDSTDACLKEAGELIAAGLGREDLKEIGSLLHSDSPMPGCEVTIFKSVGLGIQDTTIAAAVLEKAEQMEVGTIVDDYDAE
jgi:ornithine cyclodeaminase/alanine dehydrogenase-like protein (mu-crystallin family)